MKHTPGPWKAHLEEANYVTGPDLGRVAMMMNLKGSHGMGGRRSSDESAANAQLIAAAPDLLGALRGMTDLWFTVCTPRGWEPDHDVQYTDAIAALKSATGETT